LKLLSGKLAPRSGRRKLGKDVRIGVFSQDLAQALPPDLSGLEHVQTLAPTVPPQRIRAALGALGLRGDAALRPIGLLSGGEKARVVLASFAIRSFNVLLLDEPTNHLDAMSVDVLVEALSGFEGAILVVTHDRFLVERIATHIAIVQDGTVTLHEGVRPELLEPVSQGSESPVSDRATATGKLDHEARKQRRRERTKAQRRFERLSKDLEKSETRLAELEARGMEVAQDYQKASEVEAQRAEEEARCEAIFEEMAELEEAIEALTDD
jgi:ATP-binding cassette subfamily F protein 3